MAFRGTFDYTLDAKNRLTVPSKFRSALADGAVLAMNTQGCVDVWKPEAYDARLEAATANLNPLGDKATALREFYNANAHDVELDSAGRVMLPSFLITHGNLGKDVVVTGAGACLEIWDRPTWQAHNERLRGRVAAITAALDGGNHEAGA